MSNLLPPNATAYERALDDAMSAEVALPIDIKELWNPDTCPIAFLPWLAWAFSVDEWDETWTEAQKRSIVAASYRIHRHKGTPYAIRETLSALGYDNITIYEGTVYYHNGQQTHSGSIRHGADSAWPMFDVILNVGLIPDAPMIQKIRNSIERYKNKRSMLRNLVFMNVLHNGGVTHNGVYKHNGGVL